MVGPTDHIYKHVYLVLWATYREEKESGDTERN